MPEITNVAQESDNRPYVRVFESVRGKEFTVFFAASESELPGDDVRLELKVLAIHDREDPKRSVVGTIVTDVISGAIGGATWAVIAATYTALAGYLQHKHGAPQASADFVVRRLEDASDRILGKDPKALDGLKLKQLEDKRWEAQFTHHGTAVRATLDPSATIIKWSQKDATNFG